MTIEITKMTNDRGYSWLWIDTEEQSFSFDSFLNNLGDIIISEKRNILTCFGPAEIIDEYTTQYGNFIVDIECDSFPGITIYSENDTFNQKIIKIVETSDFYTVREVHLTT